jgi:VCBS repeat protein
VIAVLAMAACTKHPRPSASALPSFSEHRVPVSGRNPFGVAVADFNSDGRADLVVSFADSNDLTLLLGNGDGDFAPGPIWPVGTPVARGIVAADLNHDGRMDAVLASADWNSAMVFIGDGRGGAVPTAYPAGLAPFNVAVGDLNKDGALDIVVANESDIPALEGKGMVTVLFGDGQGKFPRRLALEGGSYPADAKIADLDGDGWMDIAVVNWKSQDITIFQGRADGTFAPARSISDGGLAAAYSLAIADFDGDGKPDIAVGDLVGRVRVLYNDGAGGFARIEPLTGGRGLRCLIAADLNGDGRPDLATANTAADTATILLAKPEGGFAAPLHIPVGKQPRVVTAADLNADGKLDLVVTNSGSNDVSVLLNNGF